MPFVYANDCGCTAAPSSAPLCRVHGITPFQSRGKFQRRHYLTHSPCTHTHMPCSCSCSCRQVVVRASGRGEPCGGGSLPWPWWVWRRTRWRVGAGRPVAGVLQKFSARTPAPGQTTALARMAETDRLQTSATMERTVLIAGHEVRPLSPTLSLSSLSDSHPLPQC